MHLLLIDGLNVLRRVYEAIPVPDSAEKAEKAVNSALRSFVRIVQTIQPTHALAVFDFGGETWRHRLYPAYKEHRSPMPEPLRQALPGFMERLTATLGLQCVSVPDVEADDVIASATHAWLARFEGRVTISSSDKDLAQLLCDRVSIYHPFEEEHRDASWCVTKFGVTPAQLTDALALTGDTTDGIPGAHKIGVKTAARLLATYPTLEEVLANAASFGGATAKNLLQCLDRVRISRQLVALKKDISVGLTWSQVRVELPAT